jgi:hypothetical protein
MVFQTSAMTDFAILTYFFMYDVGCTMYDESASTQFVHRTSNIVQLCPPCQRTKTAKSCLLDKRKMKFLKRKIEKMEKLTFFLLRLPLCLRRSKLFSGSRQEGDDFV